MILYFPYQIKKCLWQKQKIRFFTTDPFFQKELEKYREHMKQWWKNPPKKKNNLDLKAPWLRFQLNSRPIVLFQKQINQKKLFHYKKKKKHYPFWGLRKYSFSKKFSSRLHLKIQQNDVFVKKQFLDSLLLKKLKKSKSSLELFKKKFIPWKQRTIQAIHSKERILEFYGKTSNTLFARKLFFKTKKIKMRRWFSFNNNISRGPKPRYVSTKKKKKKNLIWNPWRFLNKSKSFLFKTVFLRYVFFKYGFFQWFLKKRSLSKFVELFESRLINVLLRSKIAPNAVVALWLLKKGFVFVNSFSVYSPNFMCNPGDFIFVDLFKLRKKNKLLYFFFIKKRILIKKKFFLQLKYNLKRSIYRWNFNYLFSDYSGTKTIFFKKPSLFTAPKFVFGFNKYFFYNMLYRFI